MAPGNAAMELLVSVVSEERRGRPGAAADTALAAARGASPDARVAEFIIAVYAALAAGEPRLALQMLSAMGEAHDAAMSRRMRACRAWAERLDRNWYPGDTGGEFGPEGTRGFTTVGEVASGDPETMLVEACAALGPASLLSVRSLLESMVRKSARDALPLLQSGLGDLERFKEIALAAGAPASACWAMQCQADLLRRFGSAERAQQQLEAARQIYVAGGDAAGVACTWMVEGNWLATPGSSPEALGLDLAGHPEPSPFAASQDTARAAGAYDRAEAVLRGVDAPRAQAALALRRAVVSFLHHRYEEQCRWLGAADEAFADAGETSGRHLVLVHRLVAAIAGSDFVSLRQQAPPEWGTARGPIAEVAAWGTARGSVSYCAGLGRILERTAQAWEARGDLDRAEFAYLMARPLLSLSGVVPPWSVPMALAALDARRNVPVRSLVRRLRILATLPAPALASAEPIAWMRDLELTMSLIDIPTGSIGTGRIAMQTIEQGAERLRTLLEVADLGDKREAAPALDAEAIREELNAAWARNNPLDVTRSPAPARSEMTTLALVTTCKVAREQLRRAIPQVSLLLALQAERLGSDLVADQWYQTAQEQVAASGAGNRWLSVLILGAWGKHQEAQAVFEEICAGRMVDRSLLPSLALRARAFTAARELFRRFDAQSGPADLGWIDLLDRAEAALECGDAEDALMLTRRAIESFENMLAHLPRDADRAAACDDVKAAALYLLGARAHLAVAERCHQRGDNAGQAAALNDALRVSDRGHALALPHFATASGRLRPFSEERLKRWQQVATEQATAYQRYLAALAAREREIVESLSEQLADAERGLADIEASLDPEARTAILESQRPMGFTLADAQTCLPPGTCLLAYHLVGRDLVAWGISNSSAHGWYKRLPGRPLNGAISRLLSSCASGDTSPEAAELALLLIDPFAELLDRNKRVIVVPFGPLHAAPFHALPFGGEPLGATHVLSYLPAASLLAGAVVDRALGSGGALVVADPAFDPQVHPSLRRLPGAALEGKIVASLYETPDVFPADDAREAVLRRLMRERAVVHLAAHGRLDETAPNTSSIVLAGRDQLTVSDLIGLHIDADLVVLSACDTGRGVTSLGGDVIGLTRGLLAAGVKRSVVSLWPVDDVATCVTMVAFHEKLRAGLAPALALAEAQREIRAMSGSALLARYRALGGVLEPGHVSRRRKSSEPRRNLQPLRRLEPFPEVDLDEEPVPTVEQLDGYMASIWAPFVLVGY